MKKLVLILGLTLMVLLGYSQATPFNGVRVANATTAFGINIAQGVQVWDIGASKLWQCTAASASTLTLTTGSANFIQIGGTGLGGTVTNVTGTSPIMVATGTTTPVVSINTDSLASWARRKDTANLLLSRTRASHDYQAKGTYVTTITGNKMNVTGTTAIKLLPTVGIAQDSLVKMDSLATSGQWAKFGTKGLVGRSGASVYSELGIKTATVQDWEQAADSIAANHCIFQLNHTPTSGTIAVQLNGVNLKTTQYAIVETNKLRIACAVYKYDAISVSYSY